MGRVLINSFKSAFRNRKSAIFVGAMLFGLCFPVQAQQPNKIPRIGYLGGSATANPDRLEAFRLGLRELGYVEGKSILLELRFPEGDSQREHAVAVELVRLNVDIIVVAGGTPWGQGEHGGIGSTARRTRWRS